MITQSETCYMCDEPRFDDEHVPPQSLFPKQGDANGVNYRYNLITVPSCRKHNKATEKDDEYFKVALGLNISNNDVGQQHRKHSVEATLRSNLRLQRQFLLPANQKIFETSSGTGVYYGIDIQIYNRIADKIARGLYFHHSDKRWKWKREIVIIPLHLYPEIPSEHEELESLWLQRFRVAQSIVENCAPGKRYGNNQSVFYYQVLTGLRSTERAIVMVFYGNTRIIALFPDGSVKPFSSPLVY